MTDARTDATIEDTPAIDVAALLQGNARYLEAFRADAVVSPPRRRLSVLTCMDSRFTAHGFAGLEVGDAHIVRNAGGRVTDDVLRSLVFSAHLLGTRGCAVVHHSSCGLLGGDNEAFRARISEASGADASGIDFLPFADLEESVREDVALLRACDLFPADYEVRGFTYDVSTGRLRPVEG